MNESQDTMVNPGYEALLEKVDSRFTLVSLAAMRAREINSYYLGLDGALGSVAPPQVNSTARKALSMAFDEIHADKITWQRFDPVERAAEEAARREAEEQAAADAAAAAEAEAEAEREARREERRSSRHLSSVPYRR
ncbi:MAG TPA: DNA-directed RNA polymerase subunit omega [Acidimicrobiaceae bacterium]|nr:DNA-directed RNA polymerase subunit omega [Acidimicrobiaceae bacterium]HCB37300.1 DNA-directed RNA polymerase subunit omega [Acidimicrobiaceae bacterium]